MCPWYWCKNIKPSIFIHFSLSLLCPESPPFKIDYLLVRQANVTMFGRDSEIFSLFLSFLPPIQILFAFSLSLWSLWWNHNLKYKHLKHYQMKWMENEIPKWSTNCRLFIVSIERWWVEYARHTQFSVKLFMNLWPTEYLIERSNDRKIYNRINIAETIFNLFSIKISFFKMFSDNPNTLEVFFTSPPSEWVIRLECCCWFRMHIADKKNKTVQRTDFEALTY